MPNGGSDKKQTSEIATNEQGNAIRNILLLSGLIMGCIIAGALSFKGKVDESTMMVGTIIIAVYGIKHRLMRWVGVAACLVVFAYNATMETQYVWIGTGYFLLAMLFLTYKLRKIKTK